MFPANVQIPANLLPVVERLTALAESEPVVANHVVPIVKELFDFAMSSDNVTDPDVWVRALKAAILYVEQLNVEGVWLASPLVYPRPKDTPT